MLTITKRLYNSETDWISADDSRNASHTSNNYWLRFFVLLGIFMIGGITLFSWFEVNSTVIPMLLLAAGCVIFTLVVLSFTETAEREHLLLPTTTVEDLKVQSQRCIVRPKEYGRNAGYYYAIFYKGKSRVFFISSPLVDDNRTYGFFPCAEFKVVRHAENKEIIIIQAGVDWLEPEKELSSTQHADIHPNGISLGCEIIDVEFDTLLND